MKARTAAAALTVALVAAACGGGGGDDDDTSNTTAAAVTTAAATTTTAAEPATTAEPTTTVAPKPTTVTIKPMYYNSSTGQGGLAEFTVSVEQATDNALRVDFSEDEVAGLGDQYRAAVWNAVTVATLLTGAPLAGQYRAEVKGYIDGPSAGALTTVGVLALLQGSELDPEITMTGTINPDGTIGPVGGIPEKLLGAGELGITRVLIPIGQRNSMATDGSQVDVVELGKRNGVEVREVADIYEAYEAFTGEPLKRLPAASSLRLDETTYQRLQAKADEAFARYNEAVAKLGSVDPAIVEQLGELVAQGSDLAARADNLKSQGLQAGAFSYAWQAAAFADATLSLGEALQVLFTQGPDAYFTRVLASEALRGQVTSLLDTLKTFTPETLSDASVLMATYGSALDAFSVAQFGSNRLQALSEAYATGQISQEDLIGEVIVPTLYFELAGTAVDYSKAIFDVGRDLPGPDISTDVDLALTADFFRKASDANLQAFKTTVVAEYANQLGVNEAGMLSQFADFDTDIALSLQGRSVIDGLKDYIGEGEPNAEYAQLGFAISNFARNANLVAKYYSNGQLDDSGAVVGVRSDAALTAGLDLGKAQLGSSVGVLQSADVVPALQVAQYEGAGVLREGTIDDKFSALATYWEGLVSARVLAYLGGFETEGLS